MWSVVFKLGNGTAHNTKSYWFKAKSWGVDQHHSLWTITSEMPEAAKGKSSPVTKEGTTRVLWTLRAALGRLTGWRRWLIPMGLLGIQRVVLLSWVSQWFSLFKAKSSDLAPSSCSTFPQIPTAPHRPSSSERHFLPFTSFFSIYSSVIGLGDPNVFPA